MELKLYDFQAQLLLAIKGKPKQHLIKADCSAGKTICSLLWAKSTGKPSVVVITTAGVRDSHGFEREIEKFPGAFKNWYESLKDFTVVSWRGFGKWLQAHYKELDDYAVIFDEVHCGKAGISSLQGKAFLQLTRCTDYWTGWSATPGDKWEDYYAYFTACGYTKNKTDFQRRFCIITHYPFFRMVGTRNEDEYMRIKNAIFYQVDSSEMEQELPDQTNQMVFLPAPAGYKELMKTHELEGEFFDNASALLHAARRLCGSRKKLDWLRDFVIGLNTSCVVFYSYYSERDAIELALKGKVGKIWHINGELHDVPTAETIGKHDVVLVQWQAGAFGLNLQFMNFWISFSPNYSWTVSTQAKKRILRKGQTKCCHYYYLCCKDTVDSDVYEVLHNKGEFDETMWHAGDFKK